MKVYAYTGDRWCYELVLEYESIAEFFGAWNENKHLDWVKAYPYVEGQAIKGNDTYIQKNCIQAIEFMAMEWE